MGDGEGSWATEGSPGVALGGGEEARGCDWHGGGPQQAGSCGGGRRGHVSRLSGVGERLGQDWPVISPKESETVISAMDQALCQVPR